MTIAGIETIGAVKKGDRGGATSKSHVVGGLNSWKTIFLLRKKAAPVADQVFPSAALHANRSFYLCILGSDELIELFF